ncbi:alpha/beta fold hydrolase [Mycobacterium sp. ITM-2016-00317]|uniref:alpha/beta hydrolase n=1 Tax=Mycobacterium sp. ITM-2016-00317 TaxID=2099694 RepID=UPI00287F4860|nr:alpha/beta fold hydrolase [Mycobacterium sp. ITM-2016-00317]WNG87472.1 alpha/beta fold hydrolase [Mycobacterium sp. ITM-2016-00317]
MTETARYAPGRSVDLFGDPAAPTVLLWHGTQTDARATVGVLAELLAERGLSVVAPDWDSHSADGGRGDLLESVRFAQSWTDSTEPLMLVGWSLGGIAAAGLTVHAQTHHVALRHTVCLAGAFMAPDPISGRDVAADLAAAAVRTPFTLLHGTADDVVPVEASARFAESLRNAGWPVRMRELTADHGDIAGARYDAAADRYLPADDPATRRTAAEVADLIAGA